MDKREQLEQLFAEMEKAELPLRERSPLIPGEGDPEGGIVFIGEAGGFHEAKLKRPFVGQAGKLLDEALAENGLKREEVWITNVVKVRPPENRDPESEEIDQYKPFLRRELRIIQPFLIATLGRFALNWFLPEDKISRAHGYARRLGNGVVIFPLYHPAAALRSTAVKEAFKQDFAKMVGLLDQFRTGQVAQDADPVEAEIAKDGADQPSLFG